MSMPQAVRHINEIRVLDLVFRQGRISRANIAKELDLTRSTASSIVARLAEEGLVTEDNTQEDRGAGTGRPGTFVRLNAKHALFMGANIGIGYISIVVLDLEANIVAKSKFQFAQDEISPELIARRLVDAVKNVRTKLGPGRDVRGLCIAIPGVIDRSGIILRAPFLGWRRVPILDLVSNLLPDLPILVAENDANAFAIAEGYDDKDSETDTEIYLFLDAGVGGAIVNGGKLLRGHDGYAGEFGHMIIGHRGYVKLATPDGSFESYVGLDAIINRCRHYGGSVDTFEEFLDALKLSNGAALSTMVDWSYYLGRGLALFESLFNPSRIVIGGRVAPLFQLCRARVMESVQRHLLADHPQPFITLSTLGFEGPAIGAAKMLHRQLFSVNEDLVFRRNPHRQ
ncbi:transcriptional regulator [Labrys miyagiensis]|uniref:Transcriptional regulator n=1 Tax=Labrys miyagiensis TaxID=346912 RepID=A0ABQ6CRN5_9HYPH|nr:ROK family transcriptional regulator [Labrys miyagiensis]GLS22384.1 transcriptional regulator [Labrys miyagiensis]